MFTRLVKAITILVLISTPLSAGEQAPQFGHCNTAMAVMLHPLMAKLDTATGRFRSNALPNGATLIGQAAVVLETRRKELFKETDALRQEIAGVNQEFIGKLHELNRDRDKRAQDQSSPAPSTEEYSNRRRELEHEHRQKIVSVRERLSFKESELEKLNSEARLTDLLSVTDTERVFKLILDDVYEAANIVIEREKLPFVFNSATSANVPLPAAGFATENPIAEILNVSKTAPSAGGEEYSAVSRLYRWATGEKSQLYFCNDARLARFVLKGGTDITPAVIDQVYKKHKVAQSACNLVQKLFHSEMMK